MKYKKTISRKGKKISKIKKYNKMSKKRMKHRKSHSKKSKKSYSKKSYSKKSHSKKSHSKKKRGKKTKMRIRSGTGATTGTFSGKEVQKLIENKVREIKELQGELKGMGKSKERTKLEEKVNNADNELKKMMTHLDSERKQTEAARDAQASAQASAEKKIKNLTMGKEELLEKIRKLEEKNEEDNVLTEKQKKQLAKLKKDIEKAKGEIPLKKIGFRLVGAMIAIFGGAEIIDALGPDHVGTVTGNFFSKLWEGITMHGVETARHAAEAAA